MLLFSYEKLQGKIIVITGGTSGIGRHIVNAFSADNTVVNLARSCETKGNDIKCDVSVSSDVAAAFELIKQRYGRVDILINNAGYGVSGAVELFVRRRSRADFRSQFSRCFPLYKARFASYAKRR